MLRWLMSRLVVSAVIISSGRVLLTQRDPMRGSYGWLWETPGGKVEPGETLVDALQRELREELDVDAIVSPEILACYDLSPDAQDLRRRVERPCSVHFLRVVRMSGTPVAHQALVVGWFTPEELRGLRMIPGTDVFRGDLVELVRAAGSRGGEGR
jgi:8-oxo-dGTP diphosphatase